MGIWVHSSQGQEEDMALTWVGSLWASRDIGDPFQSPSLALGNSVKIPDGRDTTCLRIWKCIESLIGHLCYRGDNDNDPYCHEELQTHMSTHHMPSSRKHSSARTHWQPASVRAAFDCPLLPPLSLPSHRFLPLQLFFPPIQISNIVLFHLLMPWHALGTPQGHGHRVKLPQMVFTVVLKWLTLRHVRCPSCLSPKSRSMGNPQIVFVLDLLQLFCSASVPLIFSDHWFVGETVRFPRRTQYPCHKSLFCLNQPEWASLDYNWEFPGKEKTSSSPVSQRRRLGFKGVKKCVKFWKLLVSQLELPGSHPPFFLTSPPALGTETIRFLPSLPLSTVPTPIKQWQWQGQSPWVIPVSDCICSLRPLSFQQRAGKGPSAYWLHCSPLHFLPEHRCRCGYK